MRYAIACSSTCERARAVANTVVDTLQHPEKLQTALEALRSIVEIAQFDSHSPLKRFGRGRRLSGLAVPFEDVRRIKKALGGSMIDVILTIMARAIGKWHAAHRLHGVKELMTLVPVNLRKPEEWSEKAHVGNVATGILVPLPIRIADPLKTYREIHKRMEAKKAGPASAASPFLADMLSVLPRQFVTWMAESTFGNVDFIVTNVPGILATRYLAGAEIVAAYPFAPVAKRSPVSVALYGYRDQPVHRLGLRRDLHAGRRPIQGDDPRVVCRAPLRRRRKATCARPPHEQQPAPAATRRRTWVGRTEARRLLLRGRSVLDF